MSSDNQIIIYKHKDGIFRAYMLTSEDVKMDKKPLFKCLTMEDATREAEKYCEDNLVEYGYKFYGI